MSLVAPAEFGTESEVRVAIAVGVVERPIDDGGDTTGDTDTGGDDDPDPPAKSDEVPPEDRGVQDPARWSRTRDGTRFRRATAHEREVNGWREGTFIVDAIDPLWDSANGEPTLRLLLPEDDGSAREAILSLTAEELGPLHIMMQADENGDPDPWTFNPTFFSYQSPVSEDPTSAGRIAGTEIVLAAATDTGELLIHGLAERFTAGSELRRVEAHRWSPAWSLDALPGGAGLLPDDLLVWTWVTPSPIEEDKWPASDDETCAMMLSGNPTYCEYPWECEPCSIPVPPPANAPVGQCNDNIDNDDDGLVDHEEDPYCQHQEGCDPSDENIPNHQHKWEQGRNYILLGDMTFCAWHAQEWQAIQYERVLAIRDSYNMFDQVRESYNELVDGQGKAAMRWAGSKCWGNAQMAQVGVTDRQAAFRACMDQGDCGPLTDDYPYANLGNPRGTGAYANRAEADLEHATLLEYPHAHLSTPIDLAIVIVRAWWNYGSSPNLGSWGGTEENANGLAVVANDAFGFGGAGTPGDSRERKRAVVHETGHWFGCPHDCNAQLGNLTTAMFTDECQNSLNNLDAHTRFGSTCLGVIETKLANDPVTRRFGL